MIACPAFPNARKQPRLDNRGQAAPVAWPKREQPHLRAAGAQHVGYGGHGLRSAAAFDRIDDIGNAHAVHCDRLRCQARPPSRRLAIRA